MQVREKYADRQGDRGRACLSHDRSEASRRGQGVGAGDVNLAGRVKVLSEGDYPVKYPASISVLPSRGPCFLKRAGRRVAAFQTRNPMHRSHEYLVKIALEVTGRCFHPSGAREAESRRHSSRGSHPSDPGDDRQLFPPRDGNSGGLSDRDALCGPARSAASCPHSPEFRLLAPDRRARPCRRRRLLRPLRFASHFRRAVGRRASTPER